MNLKIREMVATLKKYIESVDLPPEVKRMAVKEAYDDITTKADNAISLELRNREEEERKAEEENENE